MACTVSIVEHSTHLVATVVGDNSVETLYQYMTEIPQACVRTGKGRVLVIVTLTGPELPMLDVYKSVVQGSDAVVDLGMRVAYVDQNLEHSVETMMLAEDVARSRGIPVRTFREVEAARRWLEADREE